MNNCPNTCMTGERWLWNNACHSMTCEQLPVYAVDNGVTKDYIFIRTGSKNEEFKTRVSEKKIGTVLEESVIYFLSIGNKAYAYYLFSNLYRDKIGKLISEACEMNNSLIAMNELFYSSDDEGFTE